MSLHTTNASAISTPITPQMHEGELRILDVDLAARLGFANPAQIRKLIKRHEENLALLGVISTVEITSGSQGGRPGKATYLNRKQAIFITGKSDTPEATAITIEIIERFDAYENGVAPAIPQTYAQALLAAALAEQEKERLAAENATLAPKAEALDALADLSGRHNLRDSAKQCGWSEQAFISRLLTLGWLYVSPVTGRKCAYADKIKAGLMDVKNVPITHRSGAVEGVGQPLITQKGLAKLRTILGPQPGTKSAATVAIVRPVPDAPRPFAKTPEPVS